MVLIMGVIHFDQELSGFPLLVCSDSGLDLSLSLLVNLAIVGILHSVQQLDFLLSIGH